MDVPPFSDPPPNIHLTSSLQPSENGYKSGCSRMDVDFRSLGKHGCKNGRGFHTSRKPDAQLAVAFAPPQAKMSCFVWVWDDVCLPNAEIMAWRCGAVHTKPHSLQRPTRKQGNTVATSSLHSISSSPCSCMFVQGSFPTSISTTSTSIYTLNIHFPNAASSQNGHLDEDDDDDDDDGQRSSLLEAPGCLLHFVMGAKESLLKDPDPWHSRPWGLGILCLGP